MRQKPKNDFLPFAAALLALFVTLGLIISATMFVGPIKKCEKRNKTNVTETNVLLLNDTNSTEHLNENATESKGIRVYAGRRMETFAHRVLMVIKSAIVGSITGNSSIGLTSGVPKKKLVYVDLGFQPLTNVRANETSASRVDLKESKAMMTGNQANSVLPSVVENAAKMKNSSHVV